MRLGDEAAGTTERWGGHLAVVVPKYFVDQHLLIDMTIGQVNRPEYDVILPPLCVMIGDDVLDGRCVATIDVNGCHVIYQAFPNDHTYGDWSRIIRAMSVREATTAICKGLK